MTDLHPHWHSTADDDGAKDIPSTAKARGSGSVRVSVRPASRLPGAVAGIVTFALAGFTIAGGWQALNLGDFSASWNAITAQVGGASSAPPLPPALLPPVVIRISGTAGFQPASATVRPGQKITWTNDQAIPHILVSQTLRDGSGAYLNTPAIFPGASESFTVGINEPNREHAIASSTDQTLHGTVIVNNSAQSASSSSRSAVFGGTDGVNLPSGQGNSQSSVRRSSSSRSSSSRRASSSRSSAAAQASDAPVFPPENTSGAPTTLDAFGSPSVLAQNSFPPVTPSPTEQPHTGPGLWAVCAMSIAILWGMSRKYFMRIQ